MSGPSFVQKVRSFPSGSSSGKKFWIKRKHCKIYRDPFDIDAPFDVSSASEAEVNEYIDNLVMWSAENNYVSFHVDQVRRSLIGSSHWDLIGWERHRRTHFKDPCEKMKEIGIPCGGRELLDDPNGPGNMAPHAGGFFFPMYDYDVPPLPPMTRDLGLGCSLPQNISKNLLWTP